MQNVDTVLVRMGNHAVPVLPEGTDMIAFLRICIDQEFFRFLPASAAILLDIPCTGADVFQKPTPFRSIGNDIQIGQLRIIVDQDLADIEDDVLDGTAQWFLPPCLKASGMAAVIAFFMTVGSASSESSSGRDHHPSLDKALLTFSER